MTKVLFICNGSTFLTRAPEGAAEGETIFGAPQGRKKSLFCLREKSAYMAQAGAPLSEHITWAGRAKERPGLGGEAAGPGKIFSFLLQ